MKRPTFKGGINIAIKIPKDRYESTLNFYKDIMDLELTKESKNSHSLKFGNNRLWLDMVENYSQTDIWLEIKTDNMENARDYLKQKGIKFRDELEKFPEGLNANWISDPAGVILLLNE